MKVFVTRKLPGFSIEELKKYMSVEVWPNSLPPDPKEIIQRQPDALLCTLEDQIDKKVIDGCSNLKFIANYAVGTNNIAIDYAKNKNIKVGYTPDVLTAATSQLAMALTLSLARHIPQSVEYVKEGHWKYWGPELFLGINFENKTLGILGMGRIGQDFSSKMHNAFGMNVIYTSRSDKKLSWAKAVSIEELFAKSDILSLHCSLEKSNFKIINKKNLNKMKKSAILINTARGALVNEDDLFESLENKNIAGCALDVTDPEPIGMNSPLLKCDNCIITPHTGSATKDTRELMAQMSVDNILSFFFPQLKKKANFVF